MAKCSLLGYCSVVFVEFLSKAKVKGFQSRALLKVTLSSHFMEERSLAIVIV